MRQLMGGKVCAGVKPAVTVLVLIHFSRVNSRRPHELQPARLLCPWNSPGKNTGLGCYTLLQEIFPTEGQNPRLLQCRQILYLLSPVTLGTFKCQNKEAFTLGMFSSHLPQFFLGGLLRLFEPSNFSPGVNGCLQTLSVQFLSPVPYCICCQGLEPVWASSRWSAPQRVLGYGLLYSASSINPH